MKKIYRIYGRYYKKIRVGEGRFGGMYLWQPMKKVLFFFLPVRTEKCFWLDDYGFERIR